MRIISFSTFKWQCKDFERDYDFNKDCCGHEGHATTETYAVVPDGPDKGRKYYYHRCCEKLCPVMQGLKEAGR